MRPELPVEIWSLVLQQAGATPPLLRAVDRSCTSKSGEPVVGFENLRTAARDDAFMRPFFPRDELDAIRKPAKKQDAGAAGPEYHRNVPLLEKFFGKRWQCKTIDVRRSIVAAYNGRSEFDHSSSLSDFDLAMALVSSSQPGFAHHAYLQFEQNLRLDKSLTLKAVANNAAVYRSIAFPQSMLGDRDVALVALVTCPGNAQWLPNSLKNDHELWLQACARNPLVVAGWPSVFEYLPLPLQTPEARQALLSRDSILGGHWPLRFTSRLEVLAASLVPEHDQEEFYRLSRGFRDREVVTHLLHSQTFSKSWDVAKLFDDPLSSTSLFDDKTLVLLAINNLLIDEDKMLKRFHDDVDVALALLQYRPLLHKLSRRLQATRGVALAAISTFIEQFPSLDEKFRADPQFVLCALDKSRDYIAHVPPWGLQQKSLVDAVCARYVDPLSLYEDWARDPVVVRRAVRRAPRSFASAAESLRSDEDFVVSLLSRYQFTDDFVTLHSASEDLRKQPWRLFRRAQGVGQLRSTVEYKGLCVLTSVLHMALIALVAPTSLGFFAWSLVFHPSDTERARNFYRPLNTLSDALWHWNRSAWASRDRGIEGCRSLRPEVTRGHWSLVSWMGCLARGNLFCPMCFVFEHAIF